MKEEKREERKEIVVLDAGIDMDDTVEPFMACCGGAFIPVRFR